VSCANNSKLYTANSPSSKPEAVAHLTRLERDFDKVGRLLVPLLINWTKTGDVLAQIAAKYGYEQIGRARLTNDTLMGTSAARQGVTLLTVNERDFARIAVFCPLQWSLH